MTISSLGMTSAREQMLRQHDILSSLNQKTADARPVRAVFTRIEDLPADVLARRAEAYARMREGQRIIAESQEMLQDIRNGVENHDLIAPNVSSLTRQESLQQIEYVSELIQSGQAEETTLWTGYGDRTTNDYRQYVYWLQQHVKELEGVGQSTLAQV